MIYHMILCYRPRIWEKELKNDIKDRYLQHVSLMAYSWMIYRPQGRVIYHFYHQHRPCDSSIYSVGIYWELLIEFSCDFYKTLTT